MAAAVSPMRDVRVGLALGGSGGMADVQQTCGHQLWKSVGRVHQDIYMAKTTFINSCEVKLLQNYLRLKYPANSKRTMKIF
jgi:hypothetical protein